MEVSVSGQKGLSLHELGFTFLPAYRDLLDIILLGYDIYQGMLNVLIGFVNELSNILNKLHKLTRNNACKRTKDSLEPKKIIDYMLQRYFGSLYTSEVDLGTLVTSIAIPSFCESLLYFKEAIKNACSSLFTCYREAKRVDQQTANHLKVYLKLLGCFQPNQSNKVLSANPRIAILVYHTGGRYLALGFPLGSLKPQPTSYDSAQPDVCADTTCKYSNIPIFQCKSGNTYFIFIGYPICTLNNINEPNCSLIRFTACCPLKYMIKNQHMPNQHYICNVLKRGLSVKGSPIMTDCYNHACLGRPHTNISCNDVFENAIRTEALLYKSRMSNINYLQRWNDSSNVNELAIAKGNIMFRLKRYKLSLIELGEEFELYMPVTANAVIQDTYALILRTNDNSIKALARVIASLGAHSLPLKTLSAKILIICLTHGPFIRNHIVTGNIRAAANACIKMFLGVSSYSYNYTYRPGVGGMRNLALLLLDNNTRSNVFKVLDEIAYKLSSNSTYLTPFIVHSFASLLASAVINLYDLPEEMVSATVYREYSQHENVFNMVVYEDRDGGYGFLASLDPSDLLNMLSNLITIVQQNRLNRVQALRFRGYSLKPLNKCMQNLQSLLNTVSDELVSWSGLRHLTIIPAWVIRNGISSFFIRKLCEDQPDYDIRLTQQLVGEIVSYYFDLDFNDSMFAVTGEQVRIDLNENGEYLLTSNEFLPLLQNLITKLTI